MGTAAAVNDRLSAPTDFGTASCDDDDEDENDRNPAALVLNLTRLSFGASAGVNVRLSTTRAFDKESCDNEDDDCDCCGDCDDDEDGPTVPCPVSIESSFKSSAVPPLL